MVVLLLCVLLSWIGITLFCFVAVIRARVALSRIEVELGSLRARLPAAGTETPAARPVASPPRAETPAVTRVAPPVRPVKTRAERLDALERRVGTRWLNWVGALVTLAGTGFLLKFLYDRGWIGPAGRVTIGMGIGVSLLYLGELRLRRFHPLLSQSVSAAGCGALFLTTFLSYKFYDFGGRTATFGLLCWFALFTVALAVVRRAPVLAFLGLLCAYLTPWLLSTGEDQAEILFAYLALLAAASAGVFVLCGWRGIVPLGFVLSLAHYAGWYVRFYAPDRLGIAVTGAAGLVVMFVAAALCRGVWHRKAARPEECAVAAAAHVSGLWFLWDILVRRHEAALGFGLCALALAALGALYAARRRRASSPPLESTLLGLAAGSLVLVIPAVLRAEGAMLAWALAAVVLAGIGIRARSVVLEGAAAFCLLAGPWVGLTGGVFHTGMFIPAANPVFIAWLGVVVSWFLVGRRYGSGAAGQGVREALGTGLGVASSFMLLIVLSAEAWAWFRGRIGAGGDADALRDGRTVALCVLWAAFPWLWLLRKRAAARLEALSAVHYGVLGLAFLVLLADLHHRDSIVFLNPVFWAALLLPAGIYALASRMERGGRRRTALELGAHLLVVVLVAVELGQGAYPGAWTEVSRGWVKMALISVAWALFATALLAAGISRNLPAWRWFALGLLGLTLLKVLFLDMAEVRQIWRVLSFLALGALLMACSYAYSRRERRRAGDLETHNGGDS
ncbi:MAG: DUF2339 domain-containing protein [Acidobacteria bacterium]|nr:DUF2339 domain-containing protein [Acidobacteriota bacterium]